MQKLFALVALSVATVIMSPAQTFTVIKRFLGTNGSTPSAPLIQGLDGNLYGTAYTGGAHNKGTIFIITPAGALKTLYSFCASPGCTDGSSPFAGLLLGVEGNYYGTTQVGGTNGIGTIFQIHLGGS